MTNHSHNTQAHHSRTIQIPHIYSTHYIETIRFADDVDVIIVAKYLEEVRQMANLALVTIRRWLSTGAYNWHTTKLRLF